MINIGRRMTSHLLMIQSNMDLGCFRYGCIEYVKDEIHLVRDVSHENCHIKQKSLMSLIY